MNQRNNPRLPTGDKYGDKIHDSQPEQKDVNKNIGANIYIYCIYVRRIYFL